MEGSTRVIISASVTLSYTGTLHFVATVEASLAVFLRLYISSVAPYSSFLCSLNAGGRGQASKISFAHIYSMIPQFQGFLGVTIRIQMRSLNVHAFFSVNLHGLKTSNM